MQLRATLEMIRFSHTLFAMPFALLAAVLAWSTPRADGYHAPFRWQQLLGIVCCMVFARNAAMAFNRLADRHLDALNPRTAQRHLPAGILSVRSVRWFVAINAIGFVASCTWFWPNEWPLLLSIPVLSFLLGYSYAKRFTWLAHYWLGTALLLAPVCAWISIRGESLPNDWTDLVPAVTLGIAVLLWVGGFDIIYACQDASFDVEQHLHSLPARWGVALALRAAAFSHLLMLVVLLALPSVAPQLGLGIIYYTGLALVAALILYEHSLVRADNLSRVNLAFFHVNALISVGLLLVGAVDAIW